LALGQSNQTQAMLHLLLEVDLAEIHADRTSAEKPRREQMIIPTYNCSGFLRIHIKDYNMHSTFNIQFSPH
jgi:hypothetical protein